MCIRDSCRPEYFAEFLPDYANLQELKDHYTRGGLGDMKVKRFLNNVLQAEDVYKRQAYAVYTQYNHKTLGVIGGLSDQEKESSQDRIKLTLSEGWGINGRDDVTEVINKLLTKGHRETYLKTVKKLEKKGLLELSTEEAMTNFSEDDEEFARYQDAHEMYTPVSYTHLDVYKRQACCF